MKRPHLVERLLPHPLLSMTLVAVWMLLLNSVTPGGLILGLLFGLLVPILTRRFWPDRPRLHVGPALMGYLILVLADIVVANFHIAFVILARRNRDLRTRWLVVPLDVRSPEAISVLAGTISLTPGTVSSDVSADGRALLVHALDVEDPDAEVARIKARYESRLLRIFP